MQSYTKMRSRKFPDVIMKVIPGHFVTPNSHINYYIDMTTMKTRQSEAKAAARAMILKNIRIFYQILPWQTQHALFHWQ